jgi:hypothetical protein
MEVTTVKRALWAKEALAVFTNNVYCGRKPDDLHPEDRKTAVSDLICDLLHYAEINQMDVNGVVEDAVGMYHQECHCDVSPRSRTDD